MYSGLGWYSITYEEYAEEQPGVKFTTSFNYYYDEFDVKFETSGSNVTNGSFSMEETYKFDDDEVKNETSEIKDVMTIVNYFYIFSIILLIVSIIMIPFAAMGKMPHGIPMAILLFALILTLIVPLYYFIYFPPALETQLENVYEDSASNSGFKYEAEFYGSKNGMYPDNVNDLQMVYDMEFQPENAFWFSFIPMFIILIAIGVYSSGKKDISRSRRPQGPPPRDYEDDRPYDDYDDDYDAPPPRARDRGRGPPPRPPARRGPPPRPPRGRRGGGEYDQY
jgi:hypothetical protein